MLRWFFPHERVMTTTRPLIYVLAVSLTSRSSTISISVTSLLTLINHHTHKITNKIKKLAAQNPKTDLVILHFLFPILMHLFLPRLLLSQFIPLHVPALRTLILMTAASSACPPGCNILRTIIRRPLLPLLRELQRLLPTTLSITFTSHLHPFRKPLPTILPVVLASSTSMIFVCFHFPPLLLLQHLRHALILIGNSSSYSVP